MVEVRRQFFTSLGFGPCPRRSGIGPLFVKPRASGGHASAWTLISGRPPHQDVHRHHIRGLYDDPSRAGSQFYQRAYNTKPFLFRDSAIDGFHEAVGRHHRTFRDAEYLVKLRFLKQAPDAFQDMGLLLKMALREGCVPAL